jgi:glyoxylase-like metal-dependent hydrolase (beta-lactamase superfamily II)
VAITRPAQAARSSSWHFRSRDHEAVREEGRLGTFKSALPGAPIYATTQGDQWVRAHGRDILTMNVRARAPGDATADIPPADRFVRDGESLTIGGTQVVVSLLGEGESPAAVAYFVPEQHLLVSGDLMTPGKVPLLAAGHTRDWLRQIERLQATYPEDTRLLPGHGDETTFGAARRWQTGYITRFRALATVAAARPSSDGACITASEAQSLLAKMSREWPTDGIVSKMSPELLDQLNVEGVGHDIGAVACEGRENPVRESK